MPQWNYDADDIIRTGQQRECARPSTFAISRIGQHSDRDLLRRAKSGSLLWLAHGAYVPVDRWLTLNSTERYVLEIKALVHRDTATVVTRDAAAALHGLPLLTHNTPIAIANSGRTRGQSRSTPNGPYQPHKRLIRVSGRILPEDIVEIDGRLVTDVPKSVIDVCRSRTPHNALVLADAALQRHTDTEELSATLAAYPRAPGNAQARRLLGQATASSESIGESLTKEAIVQAGLAAVDDSRAPLLQQVSFRDDRGFIARVDFYLPELGLVVEFDGRMKYTDGGVADTQVAIAKELEREKRLKNLGLNVIRIVWSQLFDGSAVATLRQAAAEIRRHLANGGSCYRGNYAFARQPITITGKAAELAMRRRRVWSKAGRLY